MIKTKGSHFNNNFVKFYSNINVCLLFCILLILSLINMNFSEKLKTYFTKCNEMIKGSNVTICMGNEACDLDSFICSLVVGMHEKCCMVVNMSRRIFESKGELMYLINYFNINIDDLIFIEKPKGSFSLEARKLGTMFLTSSKEYKISNKKLNLILVDHHKPIEELMDHKIEMIIDHHALSDTSLSASKLYVDIDMGSCATLVTKFIGHSLFSSKHNKNSEFESKKFCSNISKMLMIPIIIDTGNFKKVTSHFDLGEFLKLKKCAGVQKQDLVFLRKELKAARLNDEKLETDIIVRKDYKTFVHHGIRFGISTVKYDYEDWVDRESKGNGNKEGMVLENKLNSFRREEGIDFYLTNRKFKNRRFVSVINCSFENKLASENDFKPINYKGFHFYEIPVEKSRKFLVPIIKQIIDQLKKE